MFLYFGDQKPESRGHARQNYNYLVPFWYRRLHYNSGNRFPDFPIGLNWGSVCRNRQRHCAVQLPGVQSEGPTWGRSGWRGPGFRQVAAAPRSDVGGRVSGPTMQRHAAGFSNGAEFHMSAVIFDEDYNNV
jgi:hypothetical protein